MQFEVLDFGRRYKYAFTVKDLAKAELALKDHVELLPCFFPGNTKVVKVNGRANEEDSSYVVRQFETAEEMRKTDGGYADAPEDKLTEIKIAHQSHNEMELKATKHDGEELDIFISVRQGIVASISGPAVFVESDWTGKYIHFPMLVHCCYLSLCGLCFLAPCMDTCCQIFKCRDYMAVTGKVKNHFKKYDKSGGD